MVGGVGRKERVRGGPSSRGGSAGRWCGDDDGGVDLEGAGFGVVLGLVVDLDVDLDVDLVIALDVDLDVDLIIVFEDASRRLEGTSSGVEGVSRAAWRRNGRRPGGMARRLARPRGDMFACVDATLPRSRLWSEVVGEKSSWVVGSGDLIDSHWLD